MGRMRAFTLMELLVVITIIVVLLALLTPALDRAIYEAEMAVRGSNFKAMGAGLVTYAMEHKRVYPDRPNDMNYLNWLMKRRTPEPNLTSKLQPYIPVNGVLNDPLNADVDYLNSGKNTWLYAEYHMFFGFQFVGYRGMIKLGDRLEYAGDSYSILAADLDRQKITGDAFANSHPDAAGRLTSLAIQDAQAGGSGAAQGGGDTTLSSWWGPARGLVDKNVLFIDGSVERYNDVKWDEAQGGGGRMVYLPERPDGAGETEVGPIATGGQFVSMIPAR